MSRKKRPVCYRYFEIPSNNLVLPLFAYDWLYPEKPGDAPHVHNLMEIGYCYDGKGELLYGDTTLPYGPGTVTIMPANYPHSTYIDVRYKNLWDHLLIDVAAFLSEVYPKSSDMPWRLGTRACADALHLPPGEHPEITRHILRVFDLYREREELYQEIAKGHLLSMLVEIARVHEQPVKTTHPSAGGTVLYSALEYIGKHYQDKITIAELAQICHMSESHFRRKFTQMMSITPVAYINHVRVKAACRMLSNQGESIGDVAAKCGFGSVSAFSRAFHGAMGTSPRQWRSACAATVSDAIG